MLLALDVAATEFYADGRYNMTGEGKSFTSDEMIEYLANLFTAGKVDTVRTVLRKLAA